MAGGEVAARSAPPQERGNDANRRYHVFHHRHGASILVGYAVMSNFSFTKLFSSITESTIWAEPDHIRIVWITMLAMCDRQGRVYSTIPGLAGRARVSVEQCEEALDRFLSPDKYSRSKEFDGRRIEEIDGGWLLLNYERYRELRDSEADKERKRKWAKKDREFKKRRQDASTVDHGGPEVAHGRPKAEDRRQKTEESIPARAGGPPHSRIYYEEAEKAGIEVAPQVPDFAALAKVFRDTGDEAKYRSVCALYFKYDDKFVVGKGYAGRFLPGCLQALLNLEHKTKSAIPDEENARRAAAARSMA